jgi:hypothetical protein
MAALVDDREHQVIAKVAHRDDLESEVRYPVQQVLPPTTNSIVALANSTFSCDIACPVSRGAKGPAKPEPRSRSPVTALWLTQATGPAVDSVAEEGVTSPRCSRVGSVPLSGQNCWPQGQLQAAYSAKSDSPSGVLTGPCLVPKKPSLGSNPLSPYSRSPPA